MKNPPAVWKTWVWSLGWEDPLGRERLPTPVFWPGEFHELYSPWGHKESDRTERLSLSCTIRKFCFLFSTLICSNILYSTLCSKMAIHSESRFPPLSTTNTTILFEIGNSQILPQTFSFLVRMRHLYISWGKSSKWCRNAIKISCEDYF